MIMANISTFRDSKSGFGKKCSFLGFSMFGVMLLFSVGFDGGCCLSFMGREAMEMKWKMFGDRGRGPWLREKRRSLKVPSQTRKKVVGPPRWKEERFKGRVRKR